MTESNQHTESNQRTLRPRAPARALFCNRTLNLKRIQAIGYDLDYTLVHYNVAEWERLAFEHLREKLLELGWPVGQMEFDPHIVSRGLLVDRELGNVVKANRFGYIKHAYHGCTELSHEDRGRIYSRVLVDLNDERWRFLNTLFSISETCMYMQLVDVLDAQGLPGVRTYDELFLKVRGSIDAAHMEGRLKQQILDNPERTIELDPEVPLTLLDQKHAGKKLLLITNSEFPYTRALLAYALDPYLSELSQGAFKTWRDLFDLVVVGARKPAFFSRSNPMLRVVDDEGSLQPMTSNQIDPGVYWGGDASQVERSLGLSGSQILYVGDHIYGDVHQSKSVRRWRTALIIPELEEELAAVEAFASQREQLDRLMHEKRHLELARAHARVELQRATAGYGGDAAGADRTDLRERIADLDRQLTELDDRIRPLARAGSELHSKRWGLMMRTGNDKSHLARQIERHADVYTTRVANFLHETPFAYLRSPRGSMPHDPLPPE